MTLEVGKVYIPTLEELHNDMLSDIRLGALAAGIEEPNVQANSDNYIFTAAIAQAVWLAYANIEVHGDSHDPTQATGDDLEAIRIALGLPQVDPSPSAGRLVVTVSGTGSFAGGEELIAPNGARVRVSAPFPGAITNSEIEGVSVGTGEETNLDPGTVLRFVNPPLNVDVEAKVSTVRPFEGGTSEEKDDRKRERILNRLRNPPAGGNWSQVREIVFNGSPAVQNCFVYPALGGPASMKVVTTRAYDRANSVYTRAFPSSINAVLRAILWGEMPSPQEIVVQSVADEAVDVGLGLTLPSAVSAGGTGQGWSDAVPWPSLEPADAGRVTITNALTNSVSANTAVSPVAGQTKIMWWSANTMEFVTRTVTAYTGSAGAWNLTLDAPFVDGAGNSPAVGDFISPAVINPTGYAATWLASLEKLGPGENSTSAGITPRAKRHPYTTERSPSDLTFIQLAELRDAHTEISDAEYGYTSATTPTVPGSVATAPNVFVPGKFGIYPK